MSKKFKLITSLDQGGVLDSTVLINKRLKKKGYKSSVIKVDKSKKKIVNKINHGDYVILQMSGYGYHKKGIPIWLIEQIKLIKKKAFKLGIHFHELNIEKKFWDPRFILMILQKYINIKLLKYSDFSVTSTKIYAKWLSKYSLGKKVYICPVHSNIDHKSNLKKKSKKIVVLFGTAGSRSEIYMNNYDQINKWIIKNNLILCDIGPKINIERIYKLIKKNKNIKIYGKISSYRVSKIFSKAYYGIFSKPLDLVNKSGSFAAFCKYKICPINVENLNFFKEKKIKKYRFLQFLPDKKISYKIISKILKTNLNFSKRNDVENYIKIYLKNYE